MLGDWIHLIAACPELSESLSTEATSTFQEPDSQLLYEAGPKAVGDRKDMGRVPDFDRGLPVLVTSES